MTPKLVIFDCDGVLVDTEPVTDKIIAASLTRHGFPVAPEDTSALFIGGTIQGIYDHVTSLGAALPPTWVDQIYAEMFATLEKGVPVFAGVCDLLDRLEVAEVQTAIASNGPPRKMEISLTPSGLYDRFAGRIYSGHTHRPKPDPLMLTRAMQAADATPSQTVFIDDSLKGAQAGLNAGVTTLGYLPGGDDGIYAARGIIPMRSMAEIATYLGV